LRNEIVEPDKVVVTTQYFWAKWAPRLGPTLTVLVICLRRHCYYNRATHERRDWCFPEQATLAREIGVETTKTIRAALSHPLATLFVRREARYVYDPARGKKIRTSDIYYVAMDDPLVPEDEALLALRAAERLLAEGRAAEVGPASSPLRRPNGQKDRQVPHRSGGRKGLQVPPPSGEFARQGSTAISTPELVHEDSTCTTKYNEDLLLPIICLFEEANAAPATPAQKSRLAVLCAQFDAIARRRDPTSSGAGWVCAAIREAVESGSSYVAPRRIARICERWSVEGGPGFSAEAASGARARRPPRVGWETHQNGSGLPPSQDDPEAEDEVAELLPERPVARGLVPRRDSWERTSLRAAGYRPDREPIPPEDGDRRSVAFSQSWAGETLALRDRSVAGDSDGGEHVRSEVDFPELGLSGRALWQAISDEARRRVTAPGDVALLTGSRLLGRDENTLIIGVPGRSAAERAELRLGQPLGEVIRGVLGRSFTLHFVSQGEWGPRPPL
jgi:hypothetical protein